MSILLLIGACIAAIAVIGLVVFASGRLTESKSNDELAQRLPDGSHINHDSSGGMWHGGSDGGGD